MRARHSPQSMRKAGAPTLVAVAGPQDALGGPGCAGCTGRTLPRALGLAVELAAERRACGLGVQLGVK